MFDGLAEDYFASADQGEVDAVYPSDRMRRSEAFATFCSVGALPMASVGTECRSESPDLAELSTWLSEQVWRDLPADPVVWDPESTQSWASEQSPNDIAVAATTVPPGGLELRMWRVEEHEDPYETVVVDLYTGQRIDTDDAELTFDPVMTDVPSGLANELHDPILRGWPEGPGAALGRVYLWHLGLSELRLFVTDETGTWTRADPQCQLPHQELFTAAGAVWVAWVDGGRVRWAEVAPGRQLRRPRQR